jgi:hypothetical protein
MISLACTDHSHVVLFSVRTLLFFPCYYTLPLSLTFFPGLGGCSGGLLPVLYVE